MNKNIPQNAENRKSNFLELKIFQHLTEFGKWQWGAILLISQFINFSLPHLPSCHLHSCSLNLLDFQYCFINVFSLSLILNHDPFFLSPFIFKLWQELDFFPYSFSKYVTFCFSNFKARMSYYLGTFNYYCYNIFIKYTHITSTF